MGRWINMRLKLLTRVGLIAIMLFGVVGVFNTVSVSATSPTMTFISTSNDGHVNASSNAVYNTVWVAGGNTVYDTGNSFTLGQSKQGNYYIYRGMVYFDTSSLAGKTITGAKLKLYGVVDNTQTNG